MLRKRKFTLCKLKGPAARLGHHVLLNHTTRHVVLRAGRVDLGTALVSAEEQ